MLQKGIERKSGDSEYERELEKNRHGKIGPKDGCILRMGRA